MDKFEIAGAEVIEREVTETGNGAHVYVPKDWLDSTVKVVRIGREESPEMEVCDVCERATNTTEEWCWTDEGGGAFFQICSDCRTNIRESTEHKCTICREDREMSKSSGFGPMGGPNQPWYSGCDTCRARVIFGRASSPRPAWID